MGKTIKEEHVDKFIQEMGTFYSAAIKLSIAWDNLDPTDYDQAAVGYPFDKDFMELVVEIGNWIDKVELLLRANNYLMTENMTVGELKKIISSLPDDVVIINKTRNGVR